LFRVSEIQEAGGIPDIQDMKCCSRKCGIPHAADTIHKVTTLGMALGALLTPQSAAGLRRYNPAVHLSDDLTAAPTATLNCKEACTKLQHPAPNYNEVQVPYW
jgi:hypothetical protein